MRKLLIMSALGLVAGCSTITKGVNQNVSVSGSPERHGECKMKNNFGTYYVKTPGTVQVHRAYGDLDVHCEYGNQRKVDLKTPSKLTPHVFGNIIFGGILGVLVDSVTQAPFDYPDEIRVPMDNKTVRVELEKKIVTTTVKRHHFVK